MRYLASADNAIATIAAALQQGINHLETAPGYGESEVYLGQALRQLAISRSDVIITTKIPPHPDAQHVYRQIERSLARLGLDYVDNLAVHGLNTSEHWEWVRSGWLAAAQRAQAEGKVRHIGFSTHGALELILMAIATGEFAFVNLHYYLLFQRHAPAIAAAASQSMGILIISPTDKGGQLYNPPSRLQELCQPYAPMALNYRFLLSDPRITTLSLGAANPSELVEPLAWADQDQPLSAEEQAVLDRLTYQRRQVLAADHCSQCYQCLPCPVEIHIPEVLRLRGLAVAYDMVEFAQYRYRMFENAGHWFPGKRGDRCTDCGDCLPRCPEGLDIPKLLRDTHQRLAGPARRRLWQTD